SYQKKLNLTKPDTYHSDLKRKEAYIAFYQNKDKQNRLMLIDELHKFSDGMLIDVRTALDDHQEDHEELGEVCWRKVVRGRFQDASKDYMIYHMLSLSFKRKLKNEGEAGSRDRPLMLTTGRYPQWRSRFLRYIDTKPNGDALRKCILSGPYKPTIVSVQAVAATDDSPAIPEHTIVETPMNMSPANKDHFESEKGRDSSDID
nr:hypothetical protein [Tanacetum cinerariifolium]